MKKLLMILAAAIFVTAAVPTTVMASAKKGQRVFKKKMRKECGFSGVKFARHHTQAEWEEIYEDHRLKEEAQKICPRLKVNKIKESWWKHLYDFVYKYALDGAIPKC
jgi:hypothetical protein